MKNFLIIISVLSIIVIAGSVFYYLIIFLPKQEVKNTVIPMVSVITNSKDLLENLSKLTILPVGEQPIIATINDAKRLINEQPVYSGSINGDVTVFYEKERRMIIYSPTRNIIVNIVPVF